jgi:hypothetical protein
MPGRLFLSEAFDPGLGPSLGWKTDRLRLQCQERDTRRERRESDPETGAANDQLAGPHAVLEVHRRAKARKLPERGNYLPEASLPADAGRTTGHVPFQRRRLLITELSVDERA